MLVTVRYLILSDIHANWPALEAVLENAAEDYDRIICCGDLVGYNPHPGEVLDWAKARCSAIVRGNHDKAVGGLEPLEWFNDVAQDAARWTMQQLTPDQMEFLRNIAQGPLVIDDFQLWHGSPRDEDEYVTASSEAAPVFANMQLPLGFFGHTHLQGAFFTKGRYTGRIAQVGNHIEQVAIDLQPDTLYMINPGSVGQPRDGDPRAAYAILDSAERAVYLRRVPYSIERVARDILQAGLPQILAQRLFHGF